MKKIKVALAGNPNVGKSALFNRLTNSYAPVSNYPGTSVEIVRGDMEIGSKKYEIIDTPGMYSLLPISEEERVARSILIDEKPDIVINVVDAKNIGRMLNLTLQLSEAGFKLILVLNMMDEARNARIGINTALLEKRLNIPVAGVVSLTGEGIEELKQRISAYV